MKRWEIINNLIEENGYTDYLEIGIRKHGNFPKIQCEHKDGVDPRGNPTYKMTSDEFFEQNEKMYDIIFIDGLHTEEQVLKDLENAFHYLKEGGTIVMHDCNPKSYKAQAVPQQQKVWNGTVWKAYVRYRCTRDDISMYVINHDHGCGILQRGEQEVYTKAPLEKCLTWDYFKNHKRELLNIR